MPPIVLNHKISGGGPYVDAFAAAAAAVALVLCAMPSGQQLITMTELGGGDRAVLGTIIFLQYCLVPIALAATITAIVLMTAML